MGTYYSLYCEAYSQAHGWQTVTPYKKRDGAFTAVPLLEGKSFVGWMVNWYALSKNKIGREELSEDVAACEGEYADWFVVYDRDLPSPDFELPEYCGYIPKDVRRRCCGDDDDSLEEAAQTLISVQEFVKLTPLEQKGFEYIEFTVPFTPYDCMRRLKRGIARCRHLYGIADDIPVRILISVS